MHHGDEVDQAMSTMLALLKAGDAVGPTRRFPGGKLTDSDKGEIVFEVGVLEGKVIVNFGAQVAYLGMSPREARRFGSLLIQKAKTITEPPQRRRQRRRGKRGARRDV